MVKILIFYIKLYPEELILNTRWKNQGVGEGQGFKNSMKYFFN